MARSAWWISATLRYGLESTIEQEGYDEVLILYNFQTFIADSNLIYISRPSTLQ